MEALTLHTGAPKVNWENNTNFISVLEAKTVNPRVKHIDTPIFFQQEKNDNGIFVPKYEKSSVMPEDTCNQPCSSPITSQGIKLMTGFRLYPTSNT